MRFDIIYMTLRIHFNEMTGVNIKRNINGLIIA